MDAIIPSRRGGRAAPRIRTILSSVVTVLVLLAGTPASAAGAAVTDPSGPARAAPSAAAAAPGSYTGLGFDTCAAPSAAQMQAWLASPYRAVGIYFGGNNRACAQPNLTPAWVAQQQAAGWHLMPIYLGPQASCTTSTKRYKIDNVNAAAQGRATADDAVARARALGLPRDSVLIYDMEAYRTDDAACRAGVLAFMSAWTARLHALSYLSGFYSSMSSGVADQVAAYRRPGYVRPDYLDFARWDGIATVTHPDIPADHWWPKRRIKQYVGDHVETHGGVSINIDNDYLDVAPLPRTRFGDYTRNGWSDLMLRRADGAVFVYDGNGTTFTGVSRRLIASGWSGMTAVTRLGDLTGDGIEDVIARGSAGYLWLYPGTAAGSLGTRIRLGTGWNSMREITAVGDFDRDGTADLLAVQSASGNLYLYPGRRTSLAARVLIGANWNSRSELTGIGDVNGDGNADLVARAANGDLHLYPGRGNRVGSRVRLATGWNGRRNLVGTGDFNRDGTLDIAAVDTAARVLYRYPIRGSGLAPRVQIATGWNPAMPLF